LSGIDGVPDGTSLEDALDRLPEVYEDLDAFLRGLGDDGLPVPEEVFISKYPDPTDSGDVVPCGGSAGNLEGDLLGLVSTKEATWARDVPLASFNAAIGNTTGLGWRVIQSHLEAFEGHGICTADHWFNNNHQALAKATTCR
jgi:hypothetical protein